MVLYSCMICSALYSCMLCISVKYGTLANYLAMATYATLPGRVPSGHLLSKHPMHRVW
jgi:hypothetical protein